MRILSSLILFMALIWNLSAQSPHGKDFSTNCGDCHTTEGWKVGGRASFNHDTTDFALIGQHRLLDCKSCHKTLVFSQTKKECAACHTDMHNQTLGLECGRCHTPKSWIVENITEVHQMSRFPLVGPHVTADCYDCHPSASLLLFEPLGVECFDCHQDEYLATTNPNHTESNFSTDCSECHFMTSFTWTGGDFNHSFFPLTEGHAISDCYQCHTQGQDYSTASPECFSCHEDDYNYTSNPGHPGLDFSINCSECHTTHPGWKPAEFRDHDVLFPIYTGKHQGEWISCDECHTAPNNYGLFSCIDCHEHNPGDTDEEHNEVGGYIYESNACFQCHPTGDAEESFNHNASNFPLTGEHLTTECSECHTNGYSETPTECFACHEPDYNQSINPNHIQISIQTACEICHTTNPDWQPALFPEHNNTYPLTGAHVNVATNCFICHEGDYVNTPDNCFGCHSDDYDQTDDPPHAVAQFSTDCETCHTNVAWVPSTFDHDGQYFPIYSGEHNGEWNTCSQCHENPSNYGQFTCLTCHEQAETGNQHSDVIGYAYNSPDCLACHPDGSAEGSFNHQLSDFPLTGAHLTTDCNLCHISGYTGTPTQCFACHEPDFNQSVNPDHNSLALPNDCENCHTTNPGWAPATFPIHNNYYPLTGAHTTIANDCNICHAGDYNNTPKECAGCHMDNYGGSTNPDHDAIGIPTDCETCHTTNPDWQPASFPIHNQYWPLTGAHLTISSDCDACHQGDYIETPNTCFGCHQADYIGTTDPNHIAAQFPTDCELCHTTIAWVPSTFDHDGQYFPIYSGSHEGEWNSCSECHPNPSNYGIFTCLTCHTQAETDPDHDEVPGYVYESNACLSCHPDGESGGGLRKFKPD